MQDPSQPDIHIEARSPSESSLAASLDQPASQDEARQTDAREFFRDGDAGPVEQGAAAHPLSAQAAIAAREVSHGAATEGSFVEPNSPEAIADEAG